MFSKNKRTNNNTHTKKNNQATLHESSIIFKTAVTGHVGERQESHVARCVCVLPQTLLKPCSASENLQNQLQNVSMWTTVLTFFEDNCITLHRKFLQSTFLTVFEGKKMPNSKHSYYL